MTFLRQTEWTPAFDKRSSDPKKNYGIHGVELRFNLIGEAGGISFRIFTNWHLPAVQEELDSHWSADSKFPHLSCHPMPAGLDGHWKKPLSYDAPHMEYCKITNGECWCDGSVLLSEDVFKIFVTEGEEAMWKELEKFYEEWQPK